MAYIIILRKKAGRMSRLEKSPPIRGFPEVVVRAVGVR
jgi:hypothetical protein